ncbi:hypothetical protein PRIPAC_75626 [Pristionchus pacificus]|uniref:RING-type domain-containing protein n=1 Tax=Pristionchus pacificus TaxID=54126 RepID=A0A2A6CFR9_PRIPA|nr:hypothetical protein PRIPAC_75626 [Pristionchus pacificus]|eukprot:PDM76861.1 hypothetical protein PRIPAC_42256 [Pristionchus pacificus]
MAATLIEAVLRHRVNLVSSLAIFPLRHTGFIGSPLAPSVLAILPLNCSSSSFFIDSSSIVVMPSLTELTMSLLFSLDETMQEDSDDSDFDGEEEEEEDDEKEEEGDEGNEEGDDSSDSDEANSDRSVSFIDSDESMSMDDLEDVDDEDGEEGSDTGSESSYRAVLRRLVSGDLSGSDTDDYDPEGEEERESTDDEEDEEFVLVDEEENAAAKLAEDKLREKEDREERKNKKLLRTAEYGACTLCAEDTVVDPVGCVHCANFIGCRKCSNRWYRSSKTNADDDIAKCPLCRQLWPAANPDVTEMKDFASKN